MHRVGPAPQAPPELFAERRARFLGLIGDGVAVVAAGPELLRSRDTEVKFRQASDFYYLTGFPEPEAVAVLTPHDPTHTLTLFVRERDPDREVWVGPRLGVEGAAEQFGATAVYPIRDLSRRLPGLLRSADRVHYPVGADPALDGMIREALVGVRRPRQRSGVGPTGLVDLEATTGPMRVVKDESEIERIRTAGRIAAAAHRAALEAAAPGVGEWEIQAVLESTMRRLGAEGPAFPSIVGSGPNATILHYVESHRMVEDGDLVLVDAGAEWGMYCSDITRTFPASGRFSSSQRDLYEIVLAAEEAAIASALPGAPVTALHDAAVRVLVRGLIDLGILPPAEPEQVIESGDFKRFYMHQTSHWLGLDVHDAGPYTDGARPLALRAGMVLTVEPGIYIPASSRGVPEAFRGLGIRIEDDVLIRPAGNEVLTRDVPVAPADIESLVGAGNARRLA